MNELTKQNINDKYINKNKQEIDTNTNKSSVKYGQVNSSYKKWIQEKSFMVSCITTLMLFVFCTGKFSPSTKSSRL